MADYVASSQGRLGYALLQAYSPSVVYNKRDLVAYQNETYAVLKDGLVGVTPVSDGQNYLMFAGQGIAGSSNASWFAGTAVAGRANGILASVIGSEAGDMYLNSDTSDIYRASAADTWDWVMNLVDSAEIAASNILTSDGETVQEALNKKLDASQGDALNEAIAGKAALVHASRHASGGADALTPAAIGAVPTTRTVNGKALSSNVTLAAADVSAAPTSHASSATTYGVSSSANYGHAKASSTSPKSSATSASVGSETSTFARGDHVHVRDNGLQVTASGNPEAIVLATTGTPPTAIIFRKNTGNNLPMDIGASGNRFRAAYFDGSVTQSSDRRMKKDIQPIDKAFDLIMGLQPSQYRMIKDDKALRYGFIAQDVWALMNALGIEDGNLAHRDPIDEDASAEDVAEEKTIYSIVYTDLIAPLIAVVQDQEKRLAALETILLSGGGKDGL